jgi:N-glycosylase/DNA lyase
LGELALEPTLFGGQVFRWKRILSSSSSSDSDSNEPQEDDKKVEVVPVYIGPLPSQTIIALRQPTPTSLEFQPLHPSDTPELQLRDELRAYLQLDTVSLADLHRHFLGCDPHYASSTSSSSSSSSSSSTTSGVRILKQEAYECLLSFICTANNNIARITQMIDVFCATLGHYLCSDAHGHDYYAFPTLAKLTHPDVLPHLEDTLRRLGFGYRAKSVAGTVALLARQDGHILTPELMKQSESESESWTEAQKIEALMAYPGVGPKVASCVALFALGCHGTVPVDTHIWAMSVQHYCRQLRGKTCAPAHMAVVQQAWRERFGPWAGWCHSTLFAQRVQKPHQKDAPQSRKKRSVEEISQS